MSIETSYTVTWHPSNTPIRWIATTDFGQSALISAESFYQKLALHLLGQG